MEDDRLVGPCPRLQILDVGMAEAPSISRSGRVRPRVMRSRITLTAAERAFATVAAASFDVSRALTSWLRPGDTLNLVRTGCAGLGLSIVREGCLVAAAGAVASLPLGDLDEVTVSADLCSEAEAAFRKHDPEFEFREWPVMVRSGDERAIMFNAWRSIGRYNICVLHGFHEGDPGTNECVAISAGGVSAPGPVLHSAEFLDGGDGLTMRRW